MPTIAVLDTEDKLVGYEEVTRVEAEQVEVPADCDLPTDGSYKWMPWKAFVPVGYGFTRIPSLAPHSLERVVYAICEVLGQDAPVEIREWRDWYRQHQKQRDEERTIFTKRKGRPNVPG